MNQKFSRQAFELIPVNELQNLLSDLQKELRERLETLPDFSAAVQNIVMELKKLGHPLYQLDVVSEVTQQQETWGSNYSDMEANGLQLVCTSPNNIHLSWIVTPQS